MRGTGQLQDYQALLWPSEHEAQALCSSPAGFACALGRALLGLVSQHHLCFWEGEYEKGWSLQLGEDKLQGVPKRWSKFQRYSDFKLSRPFWSTLYTLLILRGKESIHLTLNTAKQFTYSRLYIQQSLHTDLHHDTTFSPILTGLIETSPFPSLRGSAVTAITASALRRAPWERYQSAEDHERLCFPAPGAAGAAEDLVPDGLWAGCSSQNRGRVALAQGHIPFTDYFHFKSESLQSLAQNFQKCLEELHVFLDAQGGCKHFQVLRGAARIFGRSEELQAFLDAQLEGDLF